MAPADQFIVSKPSETPQRAIITEDGPPDVAQKLSAAEKGTTTTEESPQPEKKDTTTESSGNKPPAKNRLKQCFTSFFGSQSNLPRKTRILNWLIALFGLTTVALCIWGIPESLIQTSTQIDSFWDLVDGVYDAQAATVAELRVLSSQLVVLEASVQQINTETDRLVPIVSGIGGAVGDTLTQALGLLDTAANSVTTVSNTIESAVDAIDTYLGGVSWIGIDVLLAKTLPANFLCRFIETICHLKFQNFLNALLS